MRHAITILFSAAAVSAFCSAASAQVAGNPGDLHTPTQYTQRSDYGPFSGPGYPGYGYNYPAGYGQPFYGGGVFAPIGFLATGMGMVAGTTGAMMAVPYGVASAAPPVAASMPGCRAFQDFNGRRTAVCGP